ncbi:hypothetical protein H4R18_003454 [Coemansia javaensis]|uniref:Uncharacterized protein n=1 Tax=Coemansia javaensis TaxID=2761396 RepID=A0A9W8LGA5_9FUNG|nr:hypothetical protein H4R18_003454 [Coemansia javaensis]
MRVHRAAALAALLAACQAASTAPAPAAHSLPPELESLGPEQVARRTAEYGAGMWQSAARPDSRYSSMFAPLHRPGTPSFQPALPPTPTTTSSSSSSYDYSFVVDLSGFDGSITHYHVSYSDPWVSGEVGSGHVEPTPTPVPPPRRGSVCDSSFPGLLSFLGLDLGVRLGIELIGACVAL